MSEVDTLREAAQKFTIASDSIAGIQARLNEIESKGARLLNSPKSGRGGVNVFHKIAADDRIKSLARGDTKAARLNLDLDVKSLLTTTDFPSGQSPDYTVDLQPTRREAIVGPVQRPIRLLDVLPRIPIGTGTFEFLKVSGYTNLATYQANEGARKQQTNINTALDSAKAWTIAHWLPMSRQVLDDMPALEGFLRQLLQHGLLDKAESEIINGDGSGAISGLVTEGTTFTGSYGNRADLIGECAATMASLGYMPSHVLVNPLDWFAIQSRKDEQGNYVMGNASAPLTPALWNTPVIPSAAVTQDSALVIDSSRLVILDRQSVTIELGMTESQFIENTVTLLAEMRIGLAVFDSGAVRKISFSGSPTIE